MAERPIPIQAWVSALVRLLSPSLPRSNRIPSHDRNVHTQRLPTTTSNPLLPKHICLYCESEALVHNQITTIDYCYGIKEAITEEEDGGCVRAQNRRGLWQEQEAVDGRSEIAPSQ